MPQLNPELSSMRRRQLSTALGVGGIGVGVAGSIGDDTDHDGQPGGDGGPVEGEPEPFNAAYTFVRVDNRPLGPEDPRSDNEYYHPPHDEHHEENATYYWGLAAWTINW